jgi:hypothetical protein
VTASIAAPLVAGTVPADGFTFTASTPRGNTVRTSCPRVAAKLSLRGWRIAIDSRPERAEAVACEPCGGEHR